LNRLSSARERTDNAGRLPWCFHGENAGSFSQGFSDRLDIEADVVIQAEEVAEDDFELGLDLPVPDSTTWRNRSGAARAAAALSPRKGMG
jgi:hypothetical protein